MRVNTVNIKYKSNDFWTINDEKDNKFNILTPTDIISQLRERFQDSDDCDKI